MRSELRLPARDLDVERALSTELHEIEDLLVVDRASALARLHTLAERTGHAWCDESVVWAHGSNAEEMCIALALPPAPRLREVLSRDEQLELVRAWWSASRADFEPWAEAWFFRVVEANVVHPQKVRGAKSPEDFLERAIALPHPVGLRSPDPSPQRYD